MAKKIVKNLVNDAKMMDKPLFFACLIMILFGLLNIVTASSREASTYDYGIYYYFFKHSQMLLIGITAGFFVFQIPTRKYNKYVLLAWFLLFLLFIYTYFYGVSHRGSTRWVNIFGFSFQPGEIAKPLVAVLGAVFYERYAKLKQKNSKNADKLIGIAILLSLLLPILVFFQKDFGNASIIGTIFATLFFISPIPKKDKLRYIGALFVLGIIFVLGLLAFRGRILEPHQISRFDFLKPCTKYEVSGYQICNAYIAINDGGITGVGIGSSRQKYSYIDEPHTDMVFAIIAEEYGAALSSLIFLGYTAIMIRMIVISKASKNIRRKYLAFGIMTYMLMQILVNMGGLFGLMPLTGVALPFLSYGGSFTISFLVAIAIVLRVSVENRQEKIKIKKI